MPRLRAEYEAIDQALNAIASMRDSSNSALGTLSGTVDDMMSSWTGLAGQTFGNWWADVASKRAQEIIGEFDSLETKLRRIKQAIEELDESGAALFKQQ